MQTISNSVLKFNEILISIAYKTIIITLTNLITKGNHSLIRNDCITKTNEFVLLDL